MPWRKRRSDGFVSTLLLKSWWRKKNVFTHPGVRYQRKCPILRSRIDYSFFKHKRRVRMGCCCWSALSTDWIMFEISSYLGGELSDSDFHVWLSTRCIYQLADSITLKMVCIVLDRDRGSKGFSPNALSICTAAAVSIGQAEHLIPLWYQIRSLKASRPKSTVSIKRQLSVVVSRNFEIFTARRIQSCVSGSIRSDCVSGSANIHIHW